MKTQIERLWSWFTRRQRARQQRRQHQPDPQHAGRDLMQHSRIGSDGEREQRTGQYEKCQAHQHIGLAAIRQQHISLKHGPCHTRTHVPFPNGKVCSIDSGSAAG